MAKSYWQRLLTFLRKPAFLAAVYFAILSIIITYPLILHMRQIVGGMGGDGTYFIWLIRWYQKALFELKISPFFNPYMNYPQGWALTTTDVSPAMVALGFPGSLLFGPTFGYNFAMLFTFWLSGWGMYLWVRSLTKIEWTGLIAGSIFAILPYHMAHYLIGHLNQAGTMWFPFYFWGLYDLLRAHKFSWKPVLMASISLGLIGFSSSYYVYMTLLMTVLFAAGFLIFKGYRRLKEKVFWQGTIAFGLLSLVLVGAAMLPFLRLDSQSGLASRSVEYVSAYSASPSDYLLPPIHQWLIGKWVDDRFSPETWQESSLYVGVVTLALAVLAWVRARRTGQTQLLFIALLVGFCAFVLSLGVDLHWLGQKVVSLPRVLQGIFHRTDMPQIHLPAYYLFMHLPFFDKMRVMMRFGVFTLICTSLMAGLGAAALLQGRPIKWQRWAGALVLVLVFIEFYPGPSKGFETVDARPVDYWLADQPDSGAMVQFPFSQDADQSLVYDTLVSGKPYLGGFFNANQPEQFARITPVMNNFPSQESVDLLQQLGVAYMVVDSRRYEDFADVDERIRSLGLQQLTAVEGEYVYGWK